MVHCSCRTPRNAPAVARGLIQVERIITGSKVVVVFKCARGGPTRKVDDRRGGAPDPRPRPRHDRRRRLADVAGHRTSGRLVVLVRLKADIPTAKSPGLVRSVRLQPDPTGLTSQPVRDLHQEHVVSRCGEHASRIAAQRKLAGAVVVFLLPRPDGVERRARLHFPAEHGVQPK
jgi:hypothetical protein